MVRGTGHSEGLKAGLKGEWLARLCVLDFEHLFPSKEAKPSQTKNAKHGLDEKIGKMKLGWEGDTK